MCFILIYHLVINFHYVCHFITEPWKSADSALRPVFKIDYCYFVLRHLTLSYGFAVSGLKYKTIKPVVSYVVKCKRFKPNKVIEI